MLDLSDPMPVAHVGHWIEWFLYAVPIIAVLVAIAISAYRARHLDEEERDDRP
jgi:hypothetical protein